MNCTVAQGYVKCPVRPNLSNSHSEFIQACYWMMTAIVRTETLLLLAKLTSSAELVGRVTAHRGIQSRQLPELRRTLRYDEQVIISEGAEARFP